MATWGTLYFLAVQILNVCLGIQWTSTQTLPDGSPLDVCTGQNLTLAWTYAVAPEEHILNTDWFFKAGGQPETLIATHTAGFFLKAPSAPQQLSFMPNAGIQLFAVGNADVGRYTVHVNMNVHGSVVSSQQTVTVNISDSACGDGDDRMSNLRQRVHQMESENLFLRSRLEHLEQFPVVKDFVERPATCADVQRYDSNSGVHTLYMSDGVTIPVYCDQTGDGGWTVIQRRLDGTVEFYREWREYENGFGSFQEEFWMGLENLFRLTKDRPNMLRVELEDFNDTTAYAEYRNFSVGNFESQYLLHVSDYSGTAGDSMKDNNNAKFSALNKENDVWSTGQCAVYHHGGWWHHQCTRANLNGRYVHSPGQGEEDIFWDTFHDSNVALKRVEMKMKPI